uniref:Ovule protein n=1 Tax=Heterorhabditis bacteriophora TaxID=37862 RepID=A0A1I7WIW0_HETBA
MDDATKSNLKAIPLCKVKAGPRDGDLWIERLKVPNSTPRTVKSGSFDAVPTIYRTGSCHPEDRSLKIPTRVQNYNSLGSGRFPDEAFIYYIFHGIVPFRYAPSPYQQPLYVHAPMISPVPSYSSHVNAQLTPISHVMPVHHIGVPPQMLSTQIHCPPQPILHHVIYGQWVYSEQYFCFVLRLLMLNCILASIPVAMEAQMYPQQYYINQQHSPSYNNPGTSSNIFPCSGMQASVDGGYGSMTQDSIRESDM